MIFFLIPFEPVVAVCLYSLLQQKFTASFVEKSALLYKFYIIFLLAVYY